MDQVVLVNEQIEAGQRFLGEFQKYLPIQSAFWLKDSDEGGWSLYVASDQITDDNFDVAYEEVVRIARALGDPWFDLFAVRLIGEDDPLAKAAADVYRRYPGRTPARLSGEAFGGGSVEEVYLYPLPVPAAVS